MLTRLKVDGFKNLDGLDVRFGPFTCIAGANSVGKSNIFDAIRFLSLLSEKALREAALGVRSASPRSLFSQYGDYQGERMSFLAEFIISPTGVDEIGEVAHASSTFLRYELDLALREGGAAENFEKLEIVAERLVHIKKSEAKQRLGFVHNKSWRDSVVTGRRSSPYISTDEDGIVSLHTDAKNRNGGGRPRRRPAADLPRTMLSNVSNAIEHRTLIVVQQEMKSWSELHLESSWLQKSDPFGTRPGMSPQGEHLPVTLYSLARDYEAKGMGEAADLYAEVASRLSELIDDVDSLYVDVDQVRREMTIVLRDRADTEFRAPSLSDGTLRFLALAVMEADTRGQRVLCLEEPENGIHPNRVPAMMGLLQDLSVDVTEPVDESNPLRQVIVNTHSPVVVAHVPKDSLLLANSVYQRVASGRRSTLSLQPLKETWRALRQPDIPTIQLGQLLAYLSPKKPLLLDKKLPAGDRVIDSIDEQPNLWTGINE